jgi:ABC-type polysaccharide/polyol phosphate transport system ATPase subunit
MDNFAITVSQVSKVFRVPTERRTSLKEHFVGLFRPVGRRRHDALHGVSFQVREGEFFSVIGANGSGKSTLLKILAGIYQPTSGRVVVRGRLSPFIELGVGFNPELTARENVYLSGVLLGLTRRQVDEQFDDIVAFAELQDFLDQRLKNFSSGMLVRLAFSVAIRAHADVLLVDEVLAVGDANFQEKCFNVFRKLRAEKKTIVFVSHDLSAVREFSDRVLVLDRGRSRGVFTPGRAVAVYNRILEDQVDAELAGTGASLGGSHVMDSRPALRSVEVLNKGRETHIFHRGDDLTVRLVVVNRSAMPFRVGVSVVRTDGVYCFGTGTSLADLPLFCEREVVVEVTFERLQLQQGIYYLNVGLFGAKPSAIYEFNDRVYEFQVTHRDGYEGLVFMPHRWRVEGGRV